MYDTEWSEEYLKSAGRKPLATDTELADIAGALSKSFE
jgi:hypothetical protein